jgi:WD40 repeat protein
VNSSESQIFSGSLDSSLVSWSLKGESFHYTSSFFGHSEGISQIEVLDSYSVLISSSLSGSILIHDIRNSECLVKIDSKCDFFKVSDLGFIAICHSTLLTFFHITGYQIYQEDLHLTPLGLEFSLTGDYCLLFIADQIIVKDPTDMRLQKTWKISKVFYAKPHPVNKTLAIWKNFEKSESAFCTGKVDAKSFRKHFMNNIT